MYLNLNLYITILYFVCIQSSYLTQKLTLQGKSLHN